MFAPGAKITRMNLKPLASGKILSRFNPDRALKELRREIIKSMEFRIRENNGFSPQAKLRLTKGFKVVVGDRSITMIAIDPAFRPLIEGQKKQQMRWLLKAKTPIPIVLDTGEVIFRSATARSMDNGSWYHPGREPSNIIERAKEEAKETLRKKIKALALKELRSKMG